jgi:hypothetical protein
MLHCIDTRFTEGGEVVVLAHRPPFSYRKIPGTHFFQRLTQLQGRSRLKIPVTILGTELAAFQLVA